MNKFSFILFMNTYIAFAFNGSDMILTVLEKNLIFLLAN